MSGFLSFLVVWRMNSLRSMIHDKKLLGVCGETELSNAKQSLITMMQVRFDVVACDGLLAHISDRCTSTSFPITWPKHLRVFSVRSLVFLVASLFIVSELPTRTSLY